MKNIDSILDDMIVRPLVHDTVLSGAAHYFLPLPDLLVVRVADGAGAGDYFYVHLKTLSDLAQQMELDARQILATSQEVKDVRGS